MRVDSAQSLCDRSEKQYVLGRRQKTGGGALNIGRYYALDGSRGAPVYIDAQHPHMIFVCGKRGYGKSYTLGVFLEEIASLDDPYKQNLAVIILDTLGIFWTTQFPSTDIERIIHRWGRTPQGFAIRLLAPPKAMKQYSQHHIAVERFCVSVAELSPMHWCQLFGIKTTEPVGVALTKAILTLQATASEFSIQDICRVLHQDTTSPPVVVSAAENLFLLADSWGVFEARGLSVHELLHPGHLTVLDVSSMHNTGLKDIVVAFLSQRIFEYQVQSRKRFEQEKIKTGDQHLSLPLIWLVIDEAQVFLPSEKNTLSKEVLIEEWMRQGRQPGLCLLMATQRPSSIESEVLAHCDLLLCHRLTAQDDIDALGRIRPTYMHGELRESIKKIGCEKGVALLVDDTSESVHVIQLRPRLSWHGGAEPVICSSDTNQGMERRKMVEEM
jgi:hypothetical protein